MYICALAYVCMHVCMCVYSSVCVPVCLCARVYVCAIVFTSALFVCLRVCYVSLRVYVNVRVYVCVCVRAYIPLPKPLRSYDINTYHCRVMVALMVQLFKACGLCPESHAGAYAVLNAFFCLHVVRRIQQSYQTLRHSQHSMEFLWVTEEGLQGTECRGGALFRNCTCVFAREWALMFRAHTRANGSLLKGAH